MTINVNKSAKLVVRRGKVVSSEGYSLVNVGTIPYLNNSSIWEIFSIFYLMTPKLKKVLCQNTDLEFVMYFLHISMAITKLLL